MKTVVGFSFTENPVNILVTSGFKFLKNEKTIGDGYYEFLCPLSPNGINLEIRDIVDEELYFRFQKNRSFAPFESNNPTVLQQWPEQHPNSVWMVQGLLGRDMEDCELKDDLVFRKKYDICALWLKCRDLDLFQRMASPQKSFVWKGQPALVVTLGQSCYDLVVTS